MHRLRMEKMKRLSKKQVILAIFLLWLTACKTDRRGEDSQSLVEGSPHPSSVTVKMTGGSNGTGSASTGTKTLTTTTLGDGKIVSSGVSGKLCSLHLQKGNGKKFLIKKYGGDSGVPYMGHDDLAMTVSRLVTLIKDTDAKITLYGMDFIFTSSTSRGTSIEVTTQDNFVLSSSDSYKVLVAHNRWVSGCEFSAG